MASALALSAVSIVCPPGVTPAAAQTAAASGRYEGVLSVLWADPQDHAGEGEIIFKLNTADGRRVPLTVGPDLQSQAIQAGGKSVTVVGSSVASAAGGESVAATAIEVSAIAPQAAAVKGTKKVLYILLKFKGDRQEPFKPKHYLDLTNPMRGSGKIPSTINAFYDAVSYGVFQWSAQVAGNKWYTLSKTHAEICPGPTNGGCPNLETAGDEAMQLVKNDVDVRKFDTINFVFNNDLNCCAFGGSGYTYKGRSWGVTWEPPWGQQAGIYAHELGHSLGLPHSGWRYGTYDSNHDQMSRGTSINQKRCAFYDSVNNGGRKTPVMCDEPGSGYIMAHQNHLGWIPKAQVAIHKSRQPAVYDIEANALPFGKTLKVVQICLTDSPCTTSDPAGRFITVEVKTKTKAFDRGVPSEGVIIHDVAMARGPITGPCYVNPQTGWAMPYDATPGDWDPNTCQGAGLSNMAYLPGQTLQDDFLGFKVEVLSRKKDVYKVRVTKTK